MSDAEMMNGLLERTGILKRVRAGTIVTREPFLMLFETILDRLDEIELRLNRLEPPASS